VTEAECSASGAVLRWVVCLWGVMRPGPAQQFVSIPSISSTSGSNCLRIARELQRSVEVCITPLKVSAAWESTGKAVAPT
jgi:hypothetical protein